MANLELVALVVREYDPAIRFFVDVLKFDLVEDTPSQTNDGRPKRWVVVKPIGAQTGILLARADGEHQIARSGSSSRAASVSSCGSKTSMRRTKEWWIAESALSQHPASRLTAKSLYFLISKETAGTCWVLTQGHVR